MEELYGSENRRVTRRGCWTGDHEYCAQAVTSPAPDPTEALQASSYADLLAPISNPAAALKADNAARANAAERLNELELAQAYYYPYYSPPPPVYRYDYPAYITITTTPLLAFRA